MKDYSVYFKKPSLQEEAKRSKDKVTINKEGLLVDDVSKNLPTWRMYIEGH